MDIQQHFSELIAQRRIIDKKELPHEWYSLVRSFVFLDNPKRSIRLTSEQVTVLEQYTLEQWKALLDVQLLHQKTYGDNSNLDPVFYFTSYYFHYSFEKTLIHALMEHYSDVWKDYFLWCRKTNATYSSYMIELFSNFYGNHILESRVFQKMIIKNPNLIKWHNVKPHIPAWSIDELMCLKNQYLKDLLLTWKHDTPALDKIMSALLLKIPCDLGVFTETIHRDYAIDLNPLEHSETFRVAVFQSMALNIPYRDYCKNHNRNCEETQLIL